MTTSRVTTRIGVFVLIGLLGVFAGSLMRPDSVLAEGGCEEQECDDWLFGWLGECEANEGQKTGCKDTGSGCVTYRCDRDEGDGGDQLNPTDDALLR